MKKVLIIHNPGSGTNDIKAVQNQLVAKLETIFKLDYQITQSFDHLISLCQPASVSQYDFIIACGGDGTINAVGKHLTQQPIPLGIIPSGSGNGLANSLGITSIEKAINTIISQQTTCIDTLLITNGTSQPEFGLNVSGIGFDAHVAQLFSEEKKRGFWKYLQIVIKEFKNKSYRVKIVTEDKTIEIDSLLVSIANSNQWGNHIKINPNSSLTDGTFELICLEQLDYWHIPKLIRSLYKGTLEKHKKVHIFTSKNAKIYASHAPLHIDGDYIGNVKTHVTIEILPKSLAVFVP